MAAAKRNLLRLAVHALSATLMALAGASATRAAEQTVTLNFVNTDIDAVATAMGQMLKRNFVIDPRVKGTVNIVSGARYREMQQQQEKSQLPPSSVMPDIEVPRLPPATFPGDE